jgi:hypothetical protein
MEEMDEKVFLTNYWGSSAGWQIDGPSYPEQTGERQYTNRWVRFQCQDTARFYRDVESMCQAVEWELNDQETGWGRFEKHKNRDDSHIMPSLVRIRSLILNEIPDSLARVCEPENMKSGSSSGIAAGMISYIRTSAPHEYQRIIPRDNGASEFAPGVERDGGWKYGMVEPVQSSSLVQELWGSWPTPGWMFWGKERKPLRFGAVNPFPGSNPGFVQDTALSWISGVKWFEPVEQRGMSDERIAELRQKEDEVEWMIIGPFPNPEDDSLTEDQYPPEREIVPDTEYVVDSEALKWTKVKPEAGEFDMRRLFGKDWGIAYMFCRVKCPDARRGQVLVGTTGGYRIWINDELVSSQHTRHSNFRQDKFRAVAALKSGWNALLIKVEGAWGHWKASCRLTHQDGLPFEDVEWGF